MTKEKFAKYFYTITLIVSLVLFLFGRNLIGPKEDFKEEYYIRNLNLIYFSVFGFILPLGVLVREWILGELFKINKTMMIVKAAVFVIVFAGGLIMFYALPSVNVSQLILYFAYGSLIFIIVPSNAYNRIKIKKE